MSNPTAVAATRYWAYGALLLWAGLAVLLLNRTLFGVDEGTARVMLFLWSFVEDLANPIVTLGVPDMRAAFLFPVGFALPGNLFAAKVLTVALSALIAVGLYRWFAREDGAEAPMLATGVWLLSPLLIGQLDAIAVGPFLIGVLLAGAALDRSYRAAPMPFGGRYFAQMLLSLAAVSLHPAGLAFPIVLALHRLLDAPATSERPFIAGSERVVLPLGIAGAGVCGVWLAGGWPQVGWFNNPVTAAAAVFTGMAGPASESDAVAWIAGSVACLLLVAVLWLRRKALWGSLFGRMMVVATALSIFNGDPTWAVLALLIIVYWGFALLLGIRLPSAASLLGQRGIALVVLVVVATLFMRQDRARFDLIRHGAQLSAQDHLIGQLAGLVKDAPADATARPYRVASQWPGRTMVACGCNTLPLPPITSDEKSLQKMLDGIDFVMFDPKLAANQALSRNLALLGGQAAKTVALDAGGVIVRLQPAAAKPES